MDFEDRAREMFPGLGDDLQVAIARSAADYFADDFGYDENDAVTAAHDDIMGDIMDARR